MDKSIIIDGVDVSGCIYYRGDITANCGMFALGDFKCNEQICLYKRLKRLEQENARLKEEAEKYRIEAYKQGQYGNRQFDKYYKCYQILQEIKEIAGFHTTEADNEDVQEDMKQILQKICEVLDGN